MSFDPTQAAAAGREAVAIGEAGFYVAPSGQKVSIAAEVARAKAETVDYHFDVKVPLPAPREGATRITVVNQTSLSAARELRDAKKAPFILNFASAKHPGGGFLRGARAQEESLARASALYACIEANPMYAFHRANKDCLYTDWMIYSPAVPVFRAEEVGPLLEEPYPCSFLTAAAPNAGEIDGRDAEIEAAMRARVTRALAIAAKHGEKHLVLGAWGCGVFRNDPKVVADAFHQELHGAFRGVFEDAVFAILDGTKERKFIAPFEARLA